MVTVIKSFSLDESCSVYDAPTAVPGQYAPCLGVFRSFKDLGAAIDYSEKVFAFAKEYGVDAPIVYVIKGPTSTTRAPYEVVSASAGYSICHRASGRALSEPISEAEVSKWLIFGVSMRVGPGMMAHHADAGNVVLDYKKDHGWTMVGAGVRPGFEKDFSRIDPNTIRKPIAAALASQERRRVRP